MRTLILATVLVLLSLSAVAQQPAAPAPPPTDPSKAAYMSAKDFAAAIAKQPTDRNGNVRIFNLAPYNVGVEHRMPGMQGAAVHDHDAELFYIIDGAATIVTGGKLLNPTRPNANNSAGTAIEGGVSQALAKGDFVLVPEGVPHWFSEIKGSLTQIALHLPRSPPQ